MKYLLLGGSGFIGSNLASALSANQNVTITGLGPDPHLPNIKYIQLDFTKCKDFSNLIKDYDVIIHLISTIIPSDDLSQVNQEISNNVFPTTILLDNAAKQSKTIIFVSSGGTIYGESSHPNLESDPTNPICNYGLSKLFIEKYLNLYHHFYNLDYRIIRLSNPYSEIVYKGKKQGIIPIVIDNIIHEKPIHIWGDHQIRDYIHIDDVISGLIAVLAYQGKERIFNIGSGIGYTIDDVLAIIKSHLDQEPTIKHLPPRKCDVKQNILDIKLIKQETGWSPQIDLSTGIGKIIEHKLKTGD